MMGVSRGCVESPCLTDSIGDWWIKSLKQMPTRASKHDAKTYE